MCFVAQVFFWTKTEKFKIIPEIVPEAPSQEVMTAMSFGDDQYLFRILAMRLQNSGDVFAGFAPLRKYDYARIYRWLNALDTIDDQSKLAPFLASYYYSSVKLPEKLKFLVDYLEERSLKNLEQNWLFLSNAAIMSRYNSADMPRFFRLSKILAYSEIKEIAINYRRMYGLGFIETKEYCKAYSEVKRLYKLVEEGKVDASSEERLFFRFFFDVEAYKMDNGKFNPKRCKNLS